MSRKADCVLVIRCSMPRSRLGIVRDAVAASAALVNANAMLIAANPQATLIVHCFALPKSLPPSGRIALPQACDARPCLHASSLSRFTQLDHGLIASVTCNCWNSFTRGDSGGL